MIKLVRCLDERFALDFMLVPTDPAYLAQLKRMAQPESRIRFLEPVPMPEICRAINKYDIGIYVLEPSNFNNAHALPNKFFEFVQARIAVAIGPSPEMAALVHKHDLGLVADSFEPETLAASLNRLTAEEIMRYKLQADRAAHALSYSESGAVLLDEVRRLLGDPR